MIRIDTAIYSGYRIPPYYDSMIGEDDRTWEQDRERSDPKDAQSALGEVIIEGVDTNRGLSVCKS